MKNKILTFIVPVFATFFVGCGSSSDPSGFSKVTFPKTTKEASPTLDNAKEVKEVVTDDQSQSISALNSVYSPNENIIHVAKEILKNKNFLNEAVNENHDCQWGGKEKIVGNLDQSSGGSLLITLQECDNGDGLFDGKLLVTAKDYDSNMDDYKKLNIKILNDFESKNLPSGEPDMQIEKGAEIGIEYLDANDYIMNISFIAKQENQLFGVKDAEFYFQKVLGGEKMYQTSGRIYISNLEKFVDYDTSYDMSQTPFRYDNQDNLVGNGEARYLMADGSKMKVDVVDGEAFAFVDSDGDGIYDISE